MARVSKCRIDDSGRECTRCREYRTYEHFYRRRSGHSTMCKDCYRVTQQELREGKRPRKTVHRIDDGGRECTKCRQYKPWDEFYSAKGNPTAVRGKDCQCRSCVSAKSLEYYHENREERNEYTRRYYEENKERILQRSSEYKKENAEANRRNARADYWRNKEARLAANKAWREDNPEKARACDDRKKRNNPELYKAIQREANKRFRANHPEKVAEIEQRRRCAKLQAMPAWADRAEMLSVFKLARTLRNITNVKFHVDHIVPIQHPLVCGLHVPANLRIVTASDNLEKHNKFDPDTFDPDDVPCVRWAHLSDDEELEERVWALIDHALANQ